MSMYQLVAPQLVSNGDRLQCYIPEHVGKTGFIETCISGDEGGEYILISPIFFDPPREPIAVQPVLFKSDRAVATKTKTKILSPDLLIHISLTGVPVYLQIALETE
jgi:hypothetical protein